MQKFEGASFTAAGPWQGPNIARLKDALVMLRWIDRPYVWHANSGDEVFVVLAGEVDMHVRASASAEATVVPLGAGDILFIGQGEEHVAHPRGAARILVVEEPGSAGEPT